jgi:hypothetical protein
LPRLPKQKPPPTLPLPWKQKPEQKIDVLLRALVPMKGRTALQPRDTFIPATSVPIMNGTLLATTNMVIVLIAALLGSVALSG